MTVEQTFGILKRRFSCLHGELRLEPARACQVVTACCVLHNIGIALGDIIPAVDIFPQVDENPVVPLNLSGQRMRDHVARTFFS